MKKFLLLCAISLVAVSHLVAVPGKGNTKGFSRWAAAREKREEMHKKMDSALTQVAESIQNVKDENTKVALENIYTYLNLQHDTKKEWKESKKTRTPRSRTLKRPAKRKSPAPKRKRARFQSED